MENATLWKRWVKSIIICIQVNLGKLSDKEKQFALNEVRILASLDAPNVVAYKESFIEGNFLYIIMEHMDNGDLLKLIKSSRQKLSESQIWSYFI